MYSWSCNIYLKSWFVLKPGSYEAFPAERVFIMFIFECDRWDIYAFIFDVCIYNYKSSHYESFIFYSCWNFWIKEI